jgi:hypothetical protein
MRAIWAQDYAEPRRGRWIGIGISFPLQFANGGLLLRYVHNDIIRRPNLIDWAIRLYLF